MDNKDKSRERLMAWLGVVMAALGLWKAIQRLRALPRA
jgi:hypothetical protein